MSVQQEQMRREFFDQCAQGWEDRNYPPQKLAQTQAMLARLALQPGMTVLDVGCGQGVLLPFLREGLGDTGRIVAVDCSQAMLQSIPQRDAQAWPLLAKAESLPLLENWADAVVCFSAFPHVGDKEAAAREFFRVLKPGGRAYVLHVDGRKKLNHLHDSHAAVCGDHLPCPYTMRAIFSAAGFVRMEAEDGEDHYYFSAQK